MDTNSCDRRSEEPPRLQFTLRHLMVVVTLTAICFSLMTWIGFAGVVVFVGAASLLSLGIGIRRHNTCFGLAGVGGIAITLPLLVVGGTVAIGDGRSTIPCTISVIDSDTRKPISGATVRLRDITLHGVPEGVPLQPIPAGEPGAEGTTDANGTVTLNFEFPNSSKDGLFVHEAHVYVSPDLWLQVSTPDHHWVVLRLDAFTGTSYDWNKLPFGVMTVPLKRVN